MSYMYEDHTQKEMHDTLRLDANDSNIGGADDKALLQDEESGSGGSVTVSSSPPSACYPKSAQYMDNPSYRRDVQFQKTETVLLNTESRLLVAKDNRRKWEKEEQRRRNINQLAWNLNSYPCQPFSPTPCSTMSQPLDDSALPEGLVKIACQLGNLFGIQGAAVFFILLHFFVVAVHGRVNIKLDSMWKEAMECYGIVVRDSGGRKTQLMKHLKAPFLLFLEKIRLAHEIHSCDKRVIQEMKSVQKSFSNVIRKEIFPFPVYERFKNSEKMSLEKRFDTLRESLTEMFQDTDKSIPDQVEPPRIFFTNITPKAFIKTLEHQGGHLASCDGENGFLTNSKVLQKCSPYLLSAHDHEYIDDLTKTAGQHQLEKPAATILQMVQSNVAMNFYGNEDMKATGLSPRFVPCLATTDIGTAYADPTATEKVLTSEYEPRIEALLTRYFTQDKNADKYELTVTDGAYILIKNFEREMTEWVQSGQVSFMESFIRKAHGQAARYAAAIHAFNYANEAIEDSPISEQEMSAGIAMMRYLIPHAGYVFDVNGFTAYNNAVKIVKALLRCNAAAQTYQVTSSDIGRMTHLKKVDIEPALDILAGHNLCACYREPGRATLAILHRDFYRHFS